MSREGEEDLVEHSVTLVVTVGLAGRVGDGEGGVSGRAASFGESG